MDKEFTEIVYQFLKFKSQRLMKIKQIYEFHHRLLNKLLTSFILY